MLKKNKVDIWDMTLISGLIAIVYGINRLYKPAAYVVGGLLLTFFALEGGKSGTIHGSGK